MPDPIQDTITQIGTLCEEVGIAFTYTISVHFTRTWYSEIVEFRLAQYAVRTIVLLRTIVCAVIAPIYVDFFKK